MTRKHYIAFAEALRTSRPYIANRSTREQRACTQIWQNTRFQIMNVLAADNPHFDRHRFIEATEK
jgi:hypothetical protein